MRAEFSEFPEFTEFEAGLVERTRREGHWLTDRIDELGTPRVRGHRYPDAADWKRKFKFRVSFRVKTKAEGTENEGSFSYYDYETARKCYRKVLLALYRGKEVESFAICLNRHESKKWEEPMHMESRDESV